MTDDSQTTKSVGPNIHHPDMEMLLKQAAERVKKMAAVELKEMQDAQRESWTRQDYD